MFASGGGYDPSAIKFIPGDFGPVNVSTNSLVLRNQAVNTSVKNLVLICAGQSNFINIAPSLYSPTNGSKLDMLNIYDGTIYAAGEPVVGCSRGNATGFPGLRLADSFATTLFDRVILVPVAVNGTAASHWENGICSDRIPVAIRRLGYRGITAQTNVTIVVLWGQGESDNIGGTTQTAYTNSLNNIIAASRAEGFTGLWFVAKQTWSGGTTSSAIQAAQAAVVNHGSNVWAGPDADALNGTACSGSACRVGDNTHWADAGSTSYAAAWKTAMALAGAPFT